MPIAPPTFLRLHAAFQRGDHPAVLYESESAFDELSAVGDGSFGRELLCMVGAVHLTSERFAIGASFLEQGLGEPGSGRSTIDTTASANALDAFELALIDAYLRLGRYADAHARLTPMLEPARLLDTRFGATRAQAALASLRGDPETAHFVLNTASAIAVRMKSKFRAALVEGDRAVVLTAQGRLYEGVTAADRVMSLLVRPAVGDYQRWGNTAGASIALTIARLAANADDVMTAQRLLIQGTTAVERAESPYLNAHLALTQGAYETANGTFERGEAALIDAQRAFADLGTPPGIALTTLEQGRLARRRGLHLSAIPLCQHALAEFRALGQPRETNEATQMILSLQRATAAAT